MDHSGIDRALKDLQDGKYKSVPRVATAYGLHRSSLYRRLKNQATLKEAQIARQILTPAQEDWIVLVIQSLQRIYVVVTNDMVLAIAACVAQRYAGRQWLQRFYRRHPNLHRIDSRERSAFRRAAAIEFAIIELFDELQARCDQYNVLPCDLYDMNEIGFDHGQQQSDTPIFDKRARPSLDSTLGSSTSWAYTVECSSADGPMLDPMIVQRGEGLSLDWPAKDDYSIYSSWEFALSTEGWTDNQLALRWLQKCFIPQAAARCRGKHILLILDNYPSHCTGEFIYYCYVNQIIPIYVPLHCGYYLQPLDLGPIASLRCQYTQYLAQYTSIDADEVDRARFMRLYAKARQGLFTQQAVQDGWRQSGICPFNRDQILAHPSAPSATVRPTQQP